MQLPIVINPVEGIPSFQEYGTELWFSYYDELCSRSRLFLGAPFNEEYAPLEEKYPVSDNDADDYSDTESEFNERIYAGSEDSDFVEEDYSEEEAAYWEEQDRAAWERAILNLIEAESIGLFNLCMAELAVRFGAPP